MTRWRVSALAIAMAWGVTGCPDSGLIDSIFPGDDAGPPDMDMQPLEPDGEVDAGPDAAVDGAADDGPTPDGGRDGAIDAMPDAMHVMDAMADVIDIADAAAGDIAVDAEVDGLVEPDAAPDLGAMCAEDVDCGEGICDDGRCRPCDDGGECPGGRCEDGACLPCRDGADCAGGVCDEGACRPCIDRADCGGALCEGGACVPCADDGQCDGEVCVEGVCAPCESDEPCAPGVCGEGRCRPCADDLECGGFVCAEGACVPCEDDAACGGGLCDEGRCRPCIENAECGPAVCAMGVCRPCEADLECGAGQACLMDGRCVPATVLDAMALDPGAAAMFEFIALAELDADLAGRAAVTLFAPDNDAFRAESGLCRFTIAENALAFVRHHVVLGGRRIVPAQLEAVARAEPDGTPLPMESFEDVVVRATPEGALLVGERPVLRALPAGNGVVYVLGEGVLASAFFRDGGCAPAP